MRVLVVANDITPEFGLPVAAPGLRAWGMARGLRAHGADVDVLVNDGPVRRQWRDVVPPPQPADPRVVAFQLGLLDDYVDTHRPDAVVFTNSNFVGMLSPDRETRVVYDFFAPKMLELESGAAPRTSLARLRQEKLAALGRADVVAINGSKKGDYVRRWLAAAGRDPDDVPIVQLPFGVPYVPPTIGEGPLRIGVAGYIQPWSPAGPWVDELLEVMDEVEVDVHIVLAQHWGGGPSAISDGYARLLAHPHTVTHDPMDFEAFRRWVSTVDVTVDVFDRNDERELAMVTRTLVALCSGSAVVHPDFTEVSPLIERYEAGWLLPDGRAGALADLLARLVDDPVEVRVRRANTAALTSEVLDPTVATLALHRSLERLT